MTVSTASVARTAPDVAFRWIDFEHGSDEDWARIEELLAVRGWQSLNRRTSRVLLAESAQGGLVAFLVFQLVGYCGPLFTIPSRRGTGIAGELADRMFQFLGECGARGWIATAESPHAAQLMERYGMVKMTEPVYAMVNPGTVEV